jgi:outer membrane protein OmpA-like peptidoglycan-associated protein
LLTPVNKGETIRINNVFFDFAKATLQPESYPELDRVVEMMKLNNNFKIEIRGHTDNVGGEANNQTLSENRAQSVRNYIISKGINDSRVTSIGFGESKPVSANTSEKGRQENRRVEFKVL